MLQVALWGDSIGRGIAYDTTRGRYAVMTDHFDRLLAREGSLRIDNHSRFGATIVEGLDDFLAAGDLTASIVAMEYGGNDCNMPWADIANNPNINHLAKVELPVFEEKLAAFVHAVRDRGLRPLLVTPPPLDAQRFVAWVSQGLDAHNILTFLGDVEHVYRWQERYSIAVRRVADTLACSRFDLRDAFLEARDMPSLYSEDGMHPNEKGHRLIADAALSFFHAMRERLA